jgi:hypothetical protein
VPSPVELAQPLRAKPYFLMINLDKLHTFSKYLRVHVAVGSSGNEFVTFLAPWETSRWVVWLAAILQSKNMIHIIVHVSQVFFTELPPACTSRACSVDGRKLCPLSGTAQVVDGLLGMGVTPVALTRSGRVRAATSWVLPRSSKHSCCGPGGFFFFLFLFFSFAPGPSLARSSKHQYLVPTCLTTRVRFLWCFHSRLHLRPRHIGPSYANGSFLSGRRSHARK